MSKYGYAIAIMLLIGLGSCEEILEIPDISEQTVTLLAPSDGIVLDNNELTLNWEQVQEAEGYHIQVATPNFENAAQLVLDSIVKMDTLGYVITHIDQNLSNGTYEWRVKAFNSGFETQFTVNGFQIIGNGDLNALTTITLKRVRHSNDYQSDKTQNTAIHN